MTVLWAIEQSERFCQTDKVIHCRSENGAVPRSNCATPWRLTSLLTRNSTSERLKLIHLNEAQSPLYTFWDTHKDFDSVDVNAIKSFWRILV